MIGFVSPDLQPWIRLRVASFEQVESELEFLLDTGFNGSLVLPVDEVGSLQLPFQRNTALELADGTTVEVPIYASRVLWHDRILEVEIIAVGDKPVIGLQFLKNHSLHIEVRDGGAVSIEPLQ
jgi:clan AA aspartic protease